MATTIHDTTLIRSAALAGVVVAPEFRGAVLVAGMAFTPPAPKRH